MIVESENAAREAGMEINPGEVSLDGYCAMHTRLSKLLHDIDDGAFDEEQAMKIAHNDWEEDCIRYSTTSHLIAHVDDQRNRFLSAGSKGAIKRLGLSHLMFRWCSSLTRGTIDAASFIQAVREDLCLNSFTQTTLSDEDLDTLVEEFYYVTNNRRMGQPFEKQGDEPEAESEAEAEAVVERNGEENQETAEETEVLDPRLWEVDIEHFTTWILDGQRRPKIKRVFVDEAVTLA